MKGSDAKMLRSNTPTNIVVFVFVYKENEFTIFKYEINFSIKKIIRISRGDGRKTLVGVRLTKIQ